MKKLLVCLTFFLAFGSTFAATVPTVSSEVKVVAPERVPPVPSNGVSYVFNESWVKTLISQNNALLQINCNSSSIFKALGFGDFNKKVFSLWLEESGYEYTFDVKNCSLRANKVLNTYNYTKSLTEAQALDFADSFMKNTSLKDKVYYQLGKPFILYRNSNGPIYPMMKESSTATSSTLSDIEIDSNDTGTDVLPEYTSFSIVYPYLINGQEVREQYGNRAGIQLEVSADGVTSLNARLLSFKAAKRNSERLSGDDAVRILKNWGNSPFYTQTSTPVKFADPKKVFVLFSLWRDNKNYLYLSSGIGLKSDVKLDQYAQQPYTMILSDYKIGNNAQ